jgi:predicted AAA+ superfamily ATPase
LQKADSKKTNYVFLDEIQEINKYENAVITLFENKKIKFDIYLTGSNSKMFSSTLATLFTGRNHEIKIYPFSFKEYMMFATQQNELKNLVKNEIFDSYLNYGGMPIIFELFNNKTITKKSINDFFIDTLNKDIKKRHAIREFHKFMRFAKYAVNQDGSIFSTSSISNYLRSNNKDTANHRTIARYLS